ncbi:MAG: hypothetical protein AB7R69_03945 [Candidatus Babeliales bacterium]
MKKYIILLVTLNTLSYAMEPEYQLLLQHNDEIALPMKQQKAVTSLKKLTAQYIAKNFTQFDKTSFDTKLNEDCKELVELELPLTNDNAIAMYTKHPKREQECLDFFYQLNRPDTSQLGLIKSDMDDIKEKTTLINWKNFFQKSLNNFSQLTPEQQQQITSYCLEKCNKELTHEQMKKIRWCFEKRTMATCSCFVLSGLIALIYIIINGSSDQ